MIAARNASLISFDNLAISAVAFRGVVVTGFRPTAICGAPSSEICSCGN